jgi:hypothetical protein
LSVVQRLQRTGPWRHSLSVAQRRRNTGDTFLSQGAVAGFRGRRHSSLLRSGSVRRFAFCDSMLYRVAVVPRSPGSPRFAAHPGLMVDDVRRSSGTGVIMLVQPRPKTFRIQSCSAESFAPPSELGGGGRGGGTRVGPALTALPVQSLPAGPRCLQSRWRLVPACRRSLPAGDRGPTSWRVTYLLENRPAFPHRPD